MADGMEGVNDLIQRLQGLPTKLQNSTLGGWTTAVANRMAKRMRAVVASRANKTGTLAKAIKGKKVDPKKARALFGSIARAITFGSKRDKGYAWGLINVGTKPRYARSYRNAKTGRFQKAEFAQRAYRGRGPRMNLVATYGPGILQEILPEAERDLAKRIERAFAKAGAGG